MGFISCELMMLRKEQHIMEDKSNVLPKGGPQRSRILARQGQGTAVEDGEKELSKEETCNSPKCSGRRQESS